jgi:hypothetical protein
MWSSTRHRQLLLHLCTTCTGKISKTF